MWIPFILNVLVVVLNIGTLEYRNGNITNYSMGISVYTCFVIAAVYILFSMAIFLRRWNYIESHKRATIFTYLLMVGCVAGFQMKNPQSLISCMAPTIIILGVYLNQENPAMKKLSYYHSEMVMGFATLVENKDDLLLAAPMHDIGKIAVPDAILQKLGKLTAEEYEKMKQHTGSGKDFEPILVEVFLDMREKVEEIHRQINDQDGNENNQHREA